MADGSLRVAGLRGRHRQPGAVVRMAAAMRNLGGLSRRWRFFSEPFEVLLAASSVAAGAPAAWGTPPPSLAIQLSPWLLHVWGALLCVGGVATLWARWRIGRWEPDARTDEALVAACRLEVFGMTLLATAIGVYAAAILALGVVALQAGAFTLAYGAAFAARARIVSRQLADFERVRQRADADP